MKVLLVNGSPHKGGCTHTALSVIAAALKEDGIKSEEFWIENKPIAGCIACLKCRETDHCVFRGDSVEKFLEIAPDFDGYVFGSPVHYAGVTGNMKAFMDRIFYSGRNAAPGCFVLKPAAAVVSARRAGTTATLEQLDKYFEIEQMPIVPSRYWNEVHGYTPEDVMKDEEGVQVMEVLGHNMAWMLKAFKAADDAGIPRPEPLVNRKQTNFIR